MQRLVQGYVLGLCVCSYKGADARYWNTRVGRNAKCVMKARRIARCHLCWLDWPQPLDNGLAAHKAMACVPPKLIDCIADMTRLTVKLPR